MNATSAPFATREQLLSHVAEIEARPGYTKPKAFGVGTATIAPSGKVLDAAYAATSVDENLGAAAVIADICGHKSGTATYRVTDDQIERCLAAFAPMLADDDPDGSKHPNIAALKAVQNSAPAAGGHRVAVVAFVGSLHDAPVDTLDVYLRLHLLSQRKVRPNAQNLDGIFGLLNNVVWTNLGPFDPDGFDLVRARLRAAGTEVRVYGLDKFPAMTDYVIPSGVRIADTSRVRLGAHLADGTTVMHEGFCNFNAGTLGVAMVEGRISQGVIVGAHSDIGGGASIQGTLSGGGMEVVSIGEKCLLGANAGLGIALGDNCIVEAGCYITAGTLVKLPDGSVTKARALSGQSNLLYRRHSQTGAIEAIENGAKWTGLNDSLHAN